MGDGPFTDAMHVKKNKYVEEWNGRREITEKAFTVNPNNLFSLVLCCVVIPYGVYDMTRRELVSKGDPRREGGVEMGKGGQTGNRWRRIEVSTNYWLNTMDLVSGGECDEDV
eukprot:scaffold1548_cov237-Alexandrium_tamarense.AAC.33